jgi:DNA-binding winged helix-turn-helix (wHTH) protein
LIITFGDYALDTDRRELRRGSELRPVAPKVFDLIEYLVCHRNRVIGRDELLVAIWGGRNVSESAIATRINAARSAFGGGSEGRRFIRTVPRTGYSFVGNVRQESATECATDAARVPSADLLQIYEAKIADLERMVGRQALEIDALKEALKHGSQPRSMTTSVTTCQAASEPAKDVSKVPPRVRG